MSIRIPLPIVLGLMLATILVTPVFAQFTYGQSGTSLAERRDAAAIRRLLAEYEAAFNSRDVDRRMALCLETYYEFGFENGELVVVGNFDETRRNVSRYWSSIRDLDYSIHSVELTLDGPQASVKAHTTHLAENDRHSSIVYFALVKIDREWWIAWDSYNIIRRYY